MKLIVAGSTGFVGTEIIRLSLKRPDITTVVALSRTPISLPQSPEAGADLSKLRNVIVKNYGDYPDSVKKEFAGADACIWTVAITPSKAKLHDFSEVKRVCQESTITGLKTIQEAGANRPFRFLYTSGFTAERDQTKKPAFMAEYALMRGETENKLLAVAAESRGDLEVCVAKPGLIVARDSTSWRSIVAFVLRWTISLPNVNVSEISAAMIDQVVHGFEKEPLMNEDLVRIGRRVSGAPSSGE